MKQTKKRCTSLILVFAMLAAMLAGCNKPNDVTTPTTDPAIIHDNPTVPTQSTEAPTETTTAPTEPTDAFGWLEENLENIHQSLLGSDYAKVLNLLLGMGKELINNAQFNALLYIAYMGNGNEKDATALLENKDLDTDAFTDAFLESAEALKGNADIEEITRKLMEHMLALAETNPEAFDAVAKIGDIIQNSNPSDPTIYAARYIAAMARGDKAAMEEILKAAKENGISAETLATTSAEYIAQVKLTCISVEDLEKGILTSTTYNEQGDVVKSEETVDKDDGLLYLTVKNSDGAVTAKATLNKKTREPISRTFYIFNRTVDRDSGKIKEVSTGAKEEYDYDDGILASITAYLSNGSKNYEVYFNKDGKVTKAYDYSSGTKTEMTAAKLSSLDFEVRDGDLRAKTVPLVDSTGSVIGSQRVRYSYYNPVGLVSGWTNYVNGSKYQEVTIEYTFENNAKAEFKSITDVMYLSSGDRSTFTSYYSNNISVAVKEVLAFSSGGSYTDYQITYIDFAAHKMEEHDLLGLRFGTPSITYTRFDDANALSLSGEVRTMDGILLAKYHPTYSNGVLYSELDVHYDSAGRVTAEITYGIDRPVSLDNPKTKVLYSYEDVDPSAVTRIETIEYDTSKNIASQKELSYEFTYDANGNVTEIVEDHYEDYAWLRHKTTTYQFDEFGRRFYEAVIDRDVSTYAITGHSIQDFYDGNLKIGTIYKTYSPEIDNFVQTGQDQYFYNPDGTLQKMQVYSVKDGVGTKLQETVYSYEGGSLTGYTITTMDSAGNPAKIVYYTADDVQYRVGIYENGVLTMYRVENGELIPEEPVPDETVPEETVPEESVPEESVPEETVPEESVPEESVPEESVPEESVPEESVPEESVPEESVPEDTEPSTTPAAA